MVKESITIPVIAAGGIGCGRTMAAAMCLGASGVQVGSRFAASTESSAHQHFKEQIIAAVEGSTELTLKEITRNWSGSWSNSDNKHCLFPARPHGLAAN